jgi:dolichol-phosphate mannosyltransferase
MPGLLVLLPCYNEEAALPGLLNRLSAVHLAVQPEWRLSVLVIDDGSTDKTAEIAQRQNGALPVTLVRHEQNRGLGAALRTGIERFLAHADETDKPQALVVLDADGTHPPELLPQMLTAMEVSEQCDVVIASRYAAGGEEHGLPPLRRLYSRLTSIVFSILARVRGARDYSCGYRLYRREALERARQRYKDRLITERSFVCMAELLIKLGRTGAHVREVPLKLHYELKGGPSKMNVPATIWRYVVLAWRVLLDPHWH